MYNYYIFMDKTDFLLYYRNMDNINIDEILDNKVFFKYIDVDEQKDFYVKVVGYEKMESSDPQKGISDKGCYALHYVFKGRGFLINMENNKRYVINEGDCFVIFPDSKIRYYQDKKNPWHYVWFEFFGNRSKNVVDRCNFSDKNPVYTLKNREVSKYLFNTYSNLNDRYDDLSTKSNLLLFLCGIISERNVANNKSTKRSSLCNKVVEYINDNYSSPSLSLKELSNIFYTNDDYLSRLFHKEIGTKITSYINNIRINRARDLISNNTDKLKMKEIAYIVGFEDPLYFSRCFKKILGCSPKEFYSTHYLKDE